MLLSYHLDITLFFFQVDVKVFSLRFLILSFLIILFILLKKFSLAGILSGICRFGTIWRLVKFPSGSQDFNLEQPRITNCQYTQIIVMHVIDNVRWENYVWMKKTLSNKEFHNWQN